jgi:DNA-binding NarL/FixJ family response regulator
MQYNEVKGIAKSIARWVWKRDGYCYQEFIDRQTRKGKLGGIAKGDAYKSKREQAIQLIEQGLTQVQISHILNISTRTLRNWKSGK